MVSKLTQLVRLTGLWFVMAASLAVAQPTAKEEQVKAALLMTLFRYTNWPEQDQFDEYTIGVLGADARLLGELKKAVKAYKIRGKSVALRVLPSAQNIPSRDLQLLYLGSEYRDVSDIAAAIRRSSTLLVTENVSNKRDIMINLTYAEDGTMDFEVNRTNIVFEKLDLERSVFLIGGTELDVAELFRELDYDLVALKDDLVKKENALIEMEARQKLLNDELERKISEIGIKEQAIREKETNIGRLSELFSVIEQELAEKQLQVEESLAVLDSNRTELEKSQQKLKSASADLVEKEKRVSLLNQQIDKHAQLLEEQKEDLELQSEMIGEQRGWLRVTGIFLLSLLLLSFLLLNINRARQQANKQLQLAKDRAQQYLNVAGSIILVLDKHHNIRLVNRQGCHALGEDVAQIIGKNLVEDFVARGNRKECLDFLTRLEQDSPSNYHAFTCQLVNRAGECRDIKWLATVMDTREQFEEGIIISGEDYTERLRIEQQRNRAREAAIRANQSKTVFLSNMSHELRTPLNAILGFAQILLEDKNFTKQQKQNIETINRSGVHLLDLINDVLDLAKIEAGHVRIYEETVDLASMMNDIEAMFSVRAKDKGIKLTHSVESETPRMMLSDPGKIRQVMINLVGNAIKFTDQGGVYISASLVQSDSDYEGRASLSISVKDTGCGIDRSEHQKVFKIFEQADKTLMGSTGGTGLGLAISSQYAKLLGGVLTLESELGEGSEFTLSIPVKLADPNQQSVGAIKKKQVAGLLEKWQGTRVLVVDDIDTNRDLIMQLLKPVGFEVVCASDGQQAVEAFKALQPRIILMDRVMPVIDGLKATRQIRSLPGGEDVCIICVSASVFETERQQVFEAGSDDFLTKPFKREELFQMMGKHANLEFNYKEEVQNGNVSQTQDDFAVFYELELDVIDQLLSLQSKSELKSYVSLVADQYPMIAISLWELIERYSLEKFQSQLSLIRTEERRA